MKKIAIGIMVYAVVLVAVMIFNNVTLLSMHDFSYYYTWDGLLLSAKFALIEGPLLLFGSKLFFMKLLGEEEFYKRFGEKGEP